MASSDTTSLTLATRDLEGSRANRRLRRDGRVPGILYGGDGEPLAFSVDSRELRHALNAAGAVIELSFEGSTTTAVLKEFQRHPVRGDMMHVDFLRVRMDQPIQQPVILELEGVDEAPGIVEGGVLEQTLRELTVEALPAEVPESITFDASSLELGATVHVSDLTAPAKVTILDDPESVVASITIPRNVIEEPEEPETETEVVGEGEEGAEASTEGEGDAEGGSADAEKPDSSEE